MIYTEMFINTFFFGTSIKEFKRVRGNEYKHAKF